MSYLDYKERVIDLQLTSYGKYLISQGKFKPTYYAFFDSDVIYDNKYTSGSASPDATEAQSSIEPRIQEETPRFSTQTVFSGREVEIFSKNPDVYNDLIIGSDIEDEEKIAQGLVKIQDQPEHTEVLQQPLGKSDSRTEYAPAWNLVFYKAPLSSSRDYLSSSDANPGPIENIPQLETSIQYSIHRTAPGRPSRASFEDLGNFGFGNAPGDDASVLGLDFDDGSGIQIEQDALILRIEESNTFLEKDNFEIECYEVETVDNEEKLSPLKFYNNSEMLNSDFSEATFAKRSVEQYFTITTDKEISSEVMCPFIKKDKVKNVFQTKIFNCEDLIIDELQSNDIYLDIDDTEDICE